MIVPGTIETLQIIDGSMDLPAMRALRRAPDVVALAAPALAGVADMIEQAALSGDAAEQVPFLRTRLETVLSRSVATAGGGLLGAPPPYRLLAFDGRHVRLFGLVRVAIGAEVNLWDAQTLAIALAEDATMLLADTPDARAIEAGLAAIDRPLRILWA